jgi:hypothetical protein
MRATLRAVLAARRIPRPTPAEKLSGFFGFLLLVVMGLHPAISALHQSCRTRSNDPPRVGRLQGSWSIALRSPCCAQAQGVHPCTPAQRMRCAHACTCVARRKTESSPFLVERRLI